MYQRKVKFLNNFVDEDDFLEKTWQLDQKHDLKEYIRQKKKVKNADVQETKKEEKKVNKAKATQETKARDSEDSGKLSLFLNPISGFLF